MMIEDCFEELIRACIINKSLVIVEHWIGPLSVNDVFQQAKFAYISVGSF